MHVPCKHSHRISSAVAVSTFLLHVHFPPFKHGQKFPLHSLPVKWNNIIYFSITSEHILFSLLYKYNCTIVLNVHWRVFYQNLIHRSAYKIFSSVCHLCQLYSELIYHKNRTWESMRHLYIVDIYVMLQL